MRGKRLATLAGVLTLAVVGCSAVFVWPLLRDRWYVSRLRAEDSFLEAALLDPTKCPSSAVEQYLETEYGKNSFFQLYVTEADLQFLDDVNEANSFRWAVFFVHSDKIHQVVRTASQFASSSAQPREILRALNGYLQHLEGFSYERDEPTARKFTVVRVGDAAKKVGYYVRFKEDGSGSAEVFAEEPFSEKGQLPDEISEHDIEVMNQDFALVVERK